MQAEKDECVSASKEWDCSLNRCMTTAESFELREDFSACEEMENEEEKKKCYDDLAEGKTGVKRGEGTGGEKKGLETISLGLSAAYAALGAISLATKGGGGCISKMIMAGGSVAHLATHFLIVSKAKKKAKELKGKMEEEAKNNYDAQYQAFELLLREQEAVKEYAKKRKLTYTIVAGIYSGATAVAVAEMTSLLGMKPCSGGGSGILNINSSPKVAVMSGVGATLALILRGGAVKAEKNAEERIAKIKSIMAKFKDVTAVYCPEGREDLKNPRCYCYTKAGDPNPQRSNSAMCKEMWKKDSVNYDVTPTVYTPSKDGPQGCVAKNGTFDEFCKCRKFKDDQGENTCYKSSTSFMVPLGLKSNLADLPSMMNASNNLTGANRRGRLNLASLRQGAANLRNYSKKLLKEYNRKNPPLPLSAKRVEAMAKKLATSKMGQRFAGGSVGGASLSTKGHGSLSSAMAKARKAIDSSTPPPSSTASYSGGKKKSASKKKKASNFRWGGAERRSGVQDLQGGGDLAKKEYDYKDADIHTGDNRSLWEVISFRYITTGMKRLFEDKAP